ncbi:MAG: hypothetical protein NVSMB65_16030 [Chloroflexota bacterium]
MMDRPCPEWEQRMVAALAGDLDRQGSDQLDAHVSWCEECRDAWDGYRRADAVLQECCAVPAPVVAGASLVARGGARGSRAPRPAAVALVPRTPIGPLQVAVTERGLCRVEFGDDRVAFEAALRRAGYAPRPDEGGMTAEVVDQLTAYFAGRRKEFDVPLDLTGRSAFEADVLRTTATVAAGTLATYAGIAASVGRPRAYRAVGNALRHNPIPVVIPCHRVISTNGSLRGYAGGLGVKRTLLDLEGALAS